METKSVDNSVEEWSRNVAEVGSEGASFLPKMLEIPACLNAGRNIKSKVKSKGRGEQGTVVAGHHLVVATERKVKPGPAKPQQLLSSSAGGGHCRESRRW